MISGYAATLSSQHTHGAGAASEEVRRVRAAAQAARRAARERANADMMRDVAQAAGLEGGAEDPLLARALARVHVHAGTTA